MTIVYEHSITRNIPRLANKSCKVTWYRPVTTLVVSIHDVMSYSCDDVTSLCQDHTRRHFVYIQRCSCRRCNCHHVLIAADWRVVRSPVISCQSSMTSRHTETSHCLTPRPPRTEGRSTAFTCRPVTNWPHNVTTHVEWTWRDLRGQYRGHVKVKLICYMQSPCAACSCSGHQGRIMALRGPRP